MFLEARILMRKWFVTFVGTILVLIGKGIWVTTEQKDLIIALLERWIVELKDNLDNLWRNIPRELQPMMEKEIDEAIILAESTLEVINDS